MVEIKLNKYGLNKWRKLKIYSSSNISFIADSVDFN